MRDLAISVQGLGKRYEISHLQTASRYLTFREELLGAVRRLTGGRKAASSDTLWALRDVNFEVRQGDVLGVIGRNGAGKSTLLKIISRITPPTTGQAEMWGRIGSLLEVGTGFHPELTGRENVFLNGAILGMSRADIVRRFDEIVDFAGVERFLDTPVKRYSSGMYMRLAFAVAAHLDSDILLLDEVLAVGDAEFRKKCLGKVQEMGRSGRTTLLVSHNVQAVLRICTSALLLERGSVALQGLPHEVMRAYLSTAHGTSASRSWDNPAQAPGDDLVRLHAVRARTQGEISETIEIRQPIEIEVEYWKLQDSPLRPSANLHLFDEDGVYLFATNEFNAPAWHHAPLGRGLYRATCRIEGNFLAEGRITVMAAVSTYNPTIVHALERDAIAFQIVDRSDGDGVRGPFHGEYPGVVRPMLGWELAFERDG